METHATSVPVFDMREPIPGYVLSERLGAGGFGEVWKAEAPGGLAKAVKIVFGQLDSTRAERELKSLQRIKRVRHPMLLSLERIELVGEQLVIVTELADASLRDRFLAKQDAGLPGIPRDELLVYLRDAADALDYLVEHHELQHLDVKPENLLLVGDRVKVADFGLVRDMQETNVSLIGGLTPLYAAPEVFDGRPHRQTDQYSLAVVYQELLTGQPPFRGRTVAQLTSQHLHSTPDVTPLPTFDQAVVARALSKSPRQRFASCRALIDELLKAPATAAQTGLARRGGERAAAADAWRRPSSGDTPIPAATTTLSVGMPLPHDVVEPPPLNVSPHEACYRPAVFVALGGDATRVLGRLRQRLHDAFGNVEETPALQFLAFDTDADALSRATGDDGPAGWRFHQTVLLPLGEPREYRAKSKSLLEWMNRRWLYNIPRSRRTEGIRPLGRLAFVDHFQEILEALRGAITRALETEGLANSSRRTGLDFQAGPPRVFVVTSTAGGTGSGMALDMGYTLRKLLGEMQLSDEHLCGIFTCGWPQRATARDLGVANTIACLSELRQFATRGYPGEPACGLPQRTDGGAFRHTYLVYPDSAHNESAAAASLNEIAEYLFQSTVTPAAAFFDRCRATDGEAAQPAPETAQVRSFGLRRRGGCSDEAAAATENMLCASLLAEWVEGSEDRPATRLAGRKTLAVQRREASTQIRTMASKCADLLDLNLQRLVDRAGSLVKKRLGQDPQHLLGQAAADAWARGPRDDTRQRIEGVLRTIDVILDGAPTKDAVSRQGQPLASMLDKLLQAQGIKQRETLLNWFSQLVDTPTLRVVGARQAVRWFDVHLDRLDGQAADRLAQLQHEAQGLAEELREENPAPRGAAAAEDAAALRAALRDKMARYAHLRWQYTLYRTAAKLIRPLREVTLDSDRRLRELTECLTRLADEFKGTSASLPNSTGAAFAAPALPPPLRRCWPRLVAETDRHVHGESLALSAASPGSEANVACLARGIRAAARNALREQQRNSLAAGPAADLSHNAKQLAEQLQGAVPRLLDCGGTKRSLITLPDPAGPDGATPHAHPALAQQGITSLPVADDQITLCCEVADVPLDNVAALLIRNRTDYLDIATRLHTRIDVTWQPFQLRTSEARSEVAKKPAGTR